MRKLISSSLLLCLFAFGAAPRADGFIEGRAFFDRNELDEALPLLEDAAGREGAGAEAHAYLAETYRRLGKRDDAIRSASRALAIDPCHSFAHTVIAETCRKRAEVDRAITDTTWVHLLEAVRCDSTDGNAWMSIWNDAIFHDKWIAMETAVLMMERGGFFSPAALEFGRWLLRTLPPDAILITNGDMDTYPLLALQAAEEFRKDVVVVERGLLGTTHFIKYLRERHHLPIPFSDRKIESLPASDKKKGNYLFLSDQVFEGWLEMKRRGEFGRPIALSVTLDPAMYSGEQDHIVYAGPYYVWHEEPVGEENDRAALRTSLAAIDPGDFAGPWVSENDRSPVRRVTTHRIAGNISYSALAYVEEMIEADEHGEAVRYLDWVEEFERETVLGSIFAERIAELRRSIADRQ